MARLNSGLYLRRGGVPATNRIPRGTQGADFPNVGPNIADMPDAPGGPIPSGGPSTNLPGQIPAPPDGGLGAAPGGPPAPETSDLVGREWGKKPPSGTALDQALNNYMGGQTRRRGI